MVIPCDTAQCMSLLYLEAGAEDAGGASQPPAASDSDEGFEMLDAGPPADAGKPSAGTRSGSLPGSHVPPLPGNLLKVQPQARDLCDFMHMWGRWSHWHAVAGTNSAASQRKRKREAVDAADNADDIAEPSAGIKRPALADGLDAVLADPDDDDLILLE